MKWKRNKASEIEDRVIAGISHGSPIIYLILAIVSAVVIYLEKERIISSSGVDGLFRTVLYYAMFIIPFVLACMALCAFTGRD